MKRILLFVAAVTMLLATSAQSWESLNRRPYPQWFSDAKLGIFVHWGLYSVPAYAGKEGYGEWLYRGLMLRDEGRMRAMSHFADTSLPVRDMYSQLTDHWHAELWKPDEWARMFKESGAKYVVLVTKHHDGYCLWDSPQQPEWNSTVSGPRRNIVEELTEAVRAEGLTMGFYYSLPEWSKPIHRWTVDPADSIEPYVTQYMIPQFKELVERYKPELIFADGDWDFSSTQLHSEEVIDWYYRTVGSEAIVNDRWGRGTQHGFRTPEYSAGIADTTRPWAECRGIGRSFGLNRNEDLDNYMSDRELIQHFCELVAHGGGLTLNVGPSADGHIPFIQQERLRAMGQWLGVNGEAIYASHPFAIPCQRVHTTASLPTSATIDYDWVRNAPRKDMPVDDFSVRWTGIVRPQPAAGEYVLRAVGDDEIWVLRGDDTLLYFNHNWADNERGQATLHLDGQEELALTVVLKEKELESSARLEWSRDGVNFEPVPAEWQGEATWDRTVRCFTRKANALYIMEFERPGAVLTIDSLPPLPRNATMQMFGTSSPLRWKQHRNGRLTIDLKSVATSELNALDHCWVIKVSWP